MDNQKVYKKIRVFFSIQVISVLTLTVSCNNEPNRPNEFDLFFSFVSSERKDFFINNSDYHPSQVRLVLDNGLEWPFPFDQKPDSSYLFRITGWGYPVQLIHYGNGDIDTLVKVWAPPDRQVGDINNLEYLRFYYNDTLIADWNFESDQDLKWELWSRNHRYGEALTDPIVIAIPKKPNPEEFD